MTISFTFFSRPSKKNCTELRMNYWMYLFQLSTCSQRQARREGGSTSWCWNNVIYIFLVGTTRTSTRMEQRWNKILRHFSLFLIDIRIKNRCDNYVLCSYWMEDIIVVWFYKEWIDLHKISSNVQQHFDVADYLFFYSSHLHISHDYTTNWLYTGRWNNQRTCNRLFCHFIDNVILTVQCLVRHREREIASRFFLTSYSARIMRFQRILFEFCHFRHPHSLQLSSWTRT